jgi:hypothetical protein
MMDSCLAVYSKISFSHQEITIDVFNNLWADNGDSLSKIYAGTGAINSSMTRKGKQTVFGMINDAAKSVNRFYVNNFQDKGRQEAIDTLLGKFPKSSPIVTMNPLLKDVQFELDQQIEKVILICHFSPFLYQITIIYSFLRRN